MSDLPMALIPAVIVGTANLGSVLPSRLTLKSQQFRTFEYLDRLVELGLYAFDMACSYQLGGTERLMGAWMQSRGNRDRLFLISKGALPYPLIRPNRLNAQAIKKDLQSSLDRLGVDSIDLYLLHRDSSHANSKSGESLERLESIAQTMTELQQQGKFRAWGVSNWSHLRIRELNSMAMRRGLAPAVASSPHFSIFEWTKPPWKGCVSLAGAAQKEARKYYQESRMPVFAWSPLGRGFMAAKAGAHSVYACPANLDRIPRLETLASKYHTNSTQIALAYLLSQPFPVHTIVASRSAEKMAENLEAAQIKLSSDELNWLESGQKI